MCFTFGSVLLGRERRKKTGEHIVVAARIAWLPGYRKVYLAIVGLRIRIFRALLNDFSSRTIIMISPLDGRYVPVAQTALRIAAGLAYFVHGAQKTFGWFGGMGASGGAVELMSRFGAAGVLEVVLGVCLVVGLFTHLTAFLASGASAVGYFWIHVGSGGQLLWWVNHGEVLMLFAFIWLLFAAWGAGPYSADAWMQRKRLNR